MKRMKLAHYVAEVGKPASGYIARPASKKNYVGNFQKPTKDNAYSFTVGQSVFSYLVTGADRASNFVSASDPTITIRDTDVLVFDVNVDAPSKPFSTQYWLVVPLDNILEKLNIQDYKIKDLSLYRAYINFFNAGESPNFHIDGEGLTSLFYLN